MHQVLQCAYIPASIPESYDYYSAQAGLLTYSSVAGLPALRAVAIVWQKIAEFTAAGQFRIFACIPF